MRQRSAQILFWGMVLFWPAVVGSVFSQESSGNRTHFDELLPVEAVVDDTSSTESDESSPRVNFMGDTEFEASSDPGNPDVVNGNPAAVQIITGSGALGDWLGINENGFRFGGLHITDANGQLTGGNTPGKWGGNTLTVLDFSLDLEKSSNWKGAMIGSEVLFYFGDPVNTDAASVIGYNSLDSSTPDSRVELYQLWFRQALFDDRLVLRFGKSVATYDFNNVIRPINFNDKEFNISGLSSAILTPLYISPTQLGILPGYYDSAYGMTAALDVSDQFYVQYGLFDGNGITGRRTGLTGPLFNGYYVHLAEAGVNWTIGPDELAGKMGIGGWYQTGILTTTSGTVDGAKGGYFFASQRLTYESPGVNPNGLCAYLQLAATNSEVIDTHRFVGCGLTYFGPIPNRDHDSIGFAFAYGKMNDDPALGLGTQEAIYSWYYQMKVCKDLYLQQNLSYITTPAENPGVGDVLAVSFRAILMF